MNKKTVLLLSLLFGTTVFAGYAQNSDYVPEGYVKVWSDEFDDPTPGGKPVVRPNNGDWWYETGGNGWGNNELQYYVAGITGQDTLAAVKNGLLTIKAIKKTIESSPYTSIRMNTSKGWQYGYFEMRAKMPSGRGTWPAFWMLSKDFKSWPLDGEIDIMEYVGYDPNVVNGSIHTQSYNHSIGTQRTAKKTIANAESEFHVYALKWTEDKIRIYVDGYNYFTFSNDETGNKNTWPFNVPFYLKLNLAIGGNWGGAQGVDETLSSASYQIDYVRVYQLPTSAEVLKEELPFSSFFSQSEKKLIIQSETPGKYKLAVSDLLGRTVLKQTIDESHTAIDCSGWQNGCYIVSLGDEVHKYNQKFFKF